MPKSGASGTGHCPANPPGIRLLVLRCLQSLDLLSSKAVKIRRALDARNLAAAGKGNFVESRFLDIVQQSTRTTV